jgi:hypothetical protein
MRQRKKAVTVVNKDLLQPVLPTKAAKTFVALEREIIDGAKQRLSEGQSPEDVALFMWAGIQELNDILVAEYYRTGSVTPKQA